MRTIDFFGLGLLQKSPEGPILSNTVEQRLQQQVTEVEKDRVVTKAVLEARDQLGVSNAALARILGVSESSISRLPQKRTIDHQSKEGELALLLLRVFRSLDTLVGGRGLPKEKWFHANNKHLHGVPSQLVESVSGLVHVAEYLDAMRGEF